MKYDDASWHYGGDFPEELAPENGATHIGMFLAWCLLNDLASDIHSIDYLDELQKLKTRKETPGAWFIRNCDEKFTRDDLNTLGNEFAAYYYASDEAKFYKDYDNAVGGNLETLYHIEDSWKTYDKLASVVQKRFDVWSKREG